MTSMRHRQPLKLSHLTSRGDAHMVDVIDKPITKRSATAMAIVRLPEPCRAVLVAGGDTRKGNVLQIARIAGIMGAKRTSDLIPLCHPLGLDAVDVDLQLEGDRVVITATVRMSGRTGVEMEALTAVSVAALTIYDMLKALSHDLVIESVQLLRKSGGRSGTIKRTATTVKTR